MFEVLAIAGCGIVDRMRGDQRGLPKIIELFVYGLLVWYLIGGGAEWLALAFAALWGLGASFGWGGVVGPILYGRPGGDDGEWWQVGALRKNLWLAAFARGALWGLPVLALYPWHSGVVAAALAITIAFPLALFAGRYLHDGPRYIGTLKIARNRWGAHEVVRGLLIGVLSWSFGSIRLLCQ